MHYESAYLLLAGLATALVVSVHSVVSFDFAASQVPGWHSTILPPYFVAGAIFSGMAIVVTLMLICRVVFKLENLITMLHFDRMAKLILVTGSMVGYVYVLELFMAWYSGNPYERYAFWNRTLGPYAWASWVMIFCNAVAPQLFWLKRARSSIPILFGVSILINVGMWFERFVIVVTSLHRDFLPSSWSTFTPTLWDVTTLAGSFGLFFTLFCLFVRYLPIVSMAEVNRFSLDPSRSTVTPPPPWVPGRWRPRTIRPASTITGVTGCWPSSQPRVSSRKPAAPFVTPDTVTSMLTHRTRCTDWREPWAPALACSPIGSHLGLSGAVYWHAHAVVGKYRR